MGIVSRRGFIQAMAAAVAAASVLEVDDPERLLWRPGTKTIFLPPPKEIAHPQDAAVREIMREFEKPRIVSLSGGRYTVTLADAASALGGGAPLQVVFNDKWRAISVNGQPVSGGEADYIARRVFG
jgi:hypothetical protein